MVQLTTKKKLVSSLADFNASDVRPQVASRLQNQLAIWSIEVCGNASSFSSHVPFFHLNRFLNTNPKSIFGAKQAPNSCDSFASHPNLSLTSNVRAAACPAAGNEARTASGRPCCPCPSAGAPSPAIRLRSFGSLLRPVLRAQIPHHWCCSICRWVSKTVGNPEMGWSGKEQHGPKSSCSRLQPGEWKHGPKNPAVVTVV